MKKHLHKRPSDQIAKLIAEEKYTSAKKLLISELDKHPCDLTYLNYWGYLQYLLQDFESCLQVNQQIIKLYPHHAYAYKGKGLALVELGQPEEGILSLKKAIELDPHFFDAYHDLIITYIEHNLILKAQELLLSTPVNNQEEKKALEKLKAVVRDRIAN